MAKLGAPAVRDSSVTCDLTDDRSLLLRTLPLRTYNNNGGTDAYTQPDRGRSRPLLWGLKTGVRPVQTDIWYPSGGPVPQGIYEVVDTTDWPTGIVATSPVVYWYLAEEWATARAAVYRASSGVGMLTWVGTEPSHFKVDADQHPVFLTQENNKIVFNIGGAALTAALSESMVTGKSYPLDFQNDGTLAGEDIARYLSDAMNAAAGTADILVAMSAASQKIVISKGAGTLQLLCASGNAVQKGLWDEIGFDCAVDRTGALSYTADFVRYYQAYQQVIRCDVTGFADDASGTYTGTPGAAIEKAPDIARHILREMLKVPASAIDTASFVTARGTTWGAKPCSLYIGAPRTVADIFAELETSGNFDLVLKGGIWYCLTRDDSVPAGTPDLVDADYLSFESYYEPEDLYGTVTLTYNEAPDGGDPMEADWHIQYVPHSRTEMGETTDADVPLRYGRSEQRTFKTCLRDEADATNPLAGSRLEAIAAEAQTKRRRFRFSTKGKCLQVPVNGKIRLSRTAGLDTTGALSNVLVRVLRKRDDWARWISDVEAIEVL